MADVFRINVDFLAEKQQIAVECAAYKGKCSVYKIAAGDTLSSIAAAFGTDIKTVAALNNIPNINKIGVGQKLVVPGAKK